MLTTIDPVELEEFIGSIEQLAIRLEASRFSDDAAFLAAEASEKARRLRSTFHCKDVLTDELRAQG